MMTDYTVLPNWQEDDPPQYRRTRAIREMTAGCPCDACEWKKGCTVECRRFKHWVRTGQPQPRRKQK
jgi:hypothetical protein